MGTHLGRILGAVYWVFGGAEQDAQAEPSKTKNQNRHKQADTDDDTDSDDDSDSDEDEEYSPKKVNAKNVQVGSKNRIIQNTYTVPEPKKEETRKQVKDKSSPKKDKRVNTENFQLGSKNTIIQNTYTVPEPKKEETQKQIKDNSRDVPEAGKGKQFKNADGNALPGRVIDMLKEAKKSVGIIRGPGSLQGTGFLLKERKVMTAYHVIQSTVLEEGKTKTPNRRYTLDKKISIQFDYEEEINAGKKETTFYFTSDIPYVNTELDVVVLQLSSENIQNLPQPLEVFSEVQNMKAHMIGHPDGGILMVDHHIERFELTNEKYDKAEAWSETYGVKNGYHGITDSRKILFHSRFAHGASGSPGCYADITKKKVEVVWMLTEGYPEFYYTKLTPADRNQIPPDFLIEQAITMKEIWSDMSQRKPDLYKTIFGHRN